MDGWNTIVSFSDGLFSGAKWLLFFRRVCNLHSTKSGVKFGKGEKLRWFPEFWGFHLHIVEIHALRWAPPKFLVGSWGEWPYDWATWGGAGAPISGAMGPYL